MASGDGASARSDRADPQALLGYAPVEPGRLLAFSANPPHPANTVVLLTRRGGGSPQRTRAVAGAAPLGQAGQWFSATLPSVPAGDAVDYRAELVRAGQRVAAHPADGSWLTLNPQPLPPAPEPRTPEPTGGGPRYAHHTEFFATFEVVGRVEPIGETPEGYRIDFLVAGGTVRGPAIDAEILPGGGDWFCIRRDGVAVLDIRATYRTADGALTYYRARGLLDLGPDGHARAVAGQLRGTPPCYVTPTFHTGGAAWQWLNRVQGLGVGRVLLDEARVCYDVHLPSVGERIG